MCVGKQDVHAFFVRDAAEHPQNPKTPDSEVFEKNSSINTGIKDSLSGLSVHFFKFVIEEVDLLLIVQV
jgi:hypothetical protein